MKVLGLIPARSGSKGIPMKNIKKLNGRPLIVYTIKAALASSLDKVVVSTDCEKVAKICREYEVEVLIRPDTLAQDDTPTLSVLQNAVSSVDGRYDAVMTLQPTSPFRTEHHIDEALRIFFDDATANSLVSVVNVPHNFTQEKLMDYDGRYLTGDNAPRRRQELKAMYARNGAAIYITKTEQLNQYVFGGRILPFFMSKLDSVDIDDIEDWQLAECLMRGCVR